MRGLLGRQGLSDGGAVLCACPRLHLLLSVFCSYGLCYIEKGRHGHCFKCTCVGGLPHDPMVMLTKNTFHQREQLALAGVSEGLLRHEWHVHARRLVELGMAAGNSGERRPDRRRVSRIDRVASRNDVELGALRRNKF